MTTQVMADLETLATTADAAVIQIAAVAFDSETGATISEFNVHVRHPAGCIDPGTVFWWMQQAAAPVVAKACEASPYTTAGALAALTEWFATLGPGVAGVWSFPSSFDLPILSLAYANAKAERPWNHRLERCQRTVLAGAGFRGKDRPDVPLPDGYMVHDALSDCRMQIAWLIAASRKTGVPL